MLIYIQQLYSNILCGIDCMGHEASEHARQRKIRTFTQMHSHGTAIRVLDIGDYSQGLQLEHDIRIQFPSFCFHFTEF